MRVLIRAPRDPTGSGTRFGRRSSTPIGDRIGHAEKWGQCRIDAEPRQLERTRERSRQRATPFGPFGIWEGKDALRSGWAPYFGPDKDRTAPFAHGRHVVTNPKVDLRGDTATASWFLTDIVFRNDDGTAKDQPVVLYGTYVDECYRVGDTWKLTRTTLYFSWPVAGGAPAGLIR